MASSELNSNGLTAQDNHCIDLEDAHLEVEVNGVAWVRVLVLQLEKGSFGHLKPELLRRVLLRAYLAHENESFVDLLFLSALLALHTV